MTTHDFVVKKTKQQDFLRSKFNKLLDSVSVIDDYIVPSEKLSIAIDEKGKNVFVLAMMLSNSYMHLGDHALTTLAQRYPEIGHGFLNNHNNAPVWKAQLMADVVREHTKHNPKTFLVRTQNDTIKAVLSNQYKRFNSVYLLSFIDYYGKSKRLLINQVYNNDLSYGVQFIDPNPYSIILNGEATTRYFGVNIQNSDFGLKSLSVNIFMINGVCSNGLIFKNILKQKHLGSRIVGDTDIHFHQETVKKDTEAQILVMRDTLNTYLTQEYIDKYSDNLQKANNTIVKPSDIALLPKFGITKKDIQLIETLLDRDIPEAGIIGHKSILKLSETISYVGQNYEGEAKEITYQEAAGKFIENA